MSEHPPHFTILALGQAHVNPAIAAGSALEVRIDRAIADAFDRHALGKALELVLGNGAERSGAVVADDASARKL